MKDADRFREFIAALGEIHEKKISDTMKDIFWKALEPFDDQQCKAAFTRAIAECKWMPKPAELIELMPGGAAQVEDRATVVATEILSHLQVWGSSKFPDLNGDEIAMHLMTGRWEYKRWASSILESELKWWAKEFVEAYRSYQATDAPLRIEGSPQLKQLIRDIGG